MNLRNPLRLLAPALCLVLCLCTAGAKAANHMTATINGLDADRVHLRAEPSTEAQSLGLYFTGTSVRCESDPSQEWTKVTIGAESGYMMSRYLATSGQIDPRQPLGYVASDKGEARVWPTPSAQDEAIGPLYAGEEVIILGETAMNWLYVQVRGVLGYTPSSFITPNGRTAPGLSGPAAGLSIPEAYRRAMDGEAPEPLSYNGQSILDGELRGPSGAIFHHFAIADLDADGAAEIVLATDVDDGYIVLDEQGGRVVAIDMATRALLSLKADGTFSFSSGAADNGFGTASFAGGTAELFPLAESEMTDGGSVVYRVHGKEVSEAEYLAAVAGQEDKRDAVWFSDILPNRWKLL